jgi:hypothetical protein
VKYRHIGQLAHSDIGQPAEFQDEDSQPFHSKLQIKPINAVKPA